MRDRLRVTLFILLLSGVVVAQRSVRIGYVDMEYILENVEEFREASSQLDNRVGQWKGEMEERQRRIDQLKEDLDATQAGVQVGYDDASHFTREYKRLFGKPPKRDVEHLRQLLHET